MRSFCDTAGREWKLDITVGAVKRVREQTKVLLPSLFDDQFAPLAELSADCVKLVEVLWAAIEPQAVEKSVTPDQFAEAMGGDSLRLATEALVRATADFFTSPEQRTVLHKSLDLILATAGEFAIQATTKATEILSNLDPAELASNCLDFAMSGQASPASTPIREPLVSST